MVRKRVNESGTEGGSCRYGAVTAAGFVLGSRKSQAMICPGVTPIRLKGYNGLWSKRDFTLIYTNLQ